VVPDAQVDTLLAPYLDQVEAICAQRLTRAAVEIGPGRGESAAGNLVADAMRAHAVGSNVALVNKGALRATLAEGDVSYCDVYAMFPFDNRFVILDLTGAELEQLLEISTSGAGSFPHISGFRLKVEDGPGVTRDLDGDGESDRWETDRLLAAVDDAGRALDPEARYQLLLSDYMYGRPGHDQFVLGAIPAERVEISDARIRDAIVDLLSGREEALGDDGGWPLPQPGRARIELQEL
jgi:2',3'-cyclic-nucleotide 2'-phosphodiesterase (5'-nucleotidase family)